jgi:glycosyltransferase involved in cell wall biosynthesis
MYRPLLRLPRAERRVVILHGSEILGLGSHRRRRKRLRQLLLQADSVGYVSGPVKELVMALAPEVEDRLVAVPGAVRSNWQALPAVPRSSGLPHPEILQVGRIHPRKGQLELVEALGCLPETLKAGIRLRLIGPVSKEDYRARIEEQSGHLGVAVQFEGTLPDPILRKAYESASMLVMPSQPYRQSMEGLGLALLEAQHFGCPVIGTRMGGITEAMVEGETGLTVAAGDPAALAGAVQDLLENPERGTNMGLAGGRFVRDAFSWERNVRKLELA